MNYGSLKTVFMQTMRRLQIPEVSLHDFAEAIDSAQLFIAANLPQDVVKQLMVIESADVHPSNPRRINKPYNMLKIESARIAATRTSGLPNYIDAVVVKQNTFLSKSDYSTEKLVCEFNGYIGVNPIPADPIEGSAGSVELVYRRLPLGFMRHADFVRTGVYIATLDQDPDNPRLFNTETAGTTLSDLGIDYGKAIGGILVFGLTSRLILNTEIMQMWDDESGSFTWLLVENNGASFPSNTVDNCYIMESYTGITSGTDYVQDSVAPELGEEFHGPMLDIAIGKFLLPFKPQEAMQYIGYANQSLQAYGVMMRTEFGGSE